MKSALKSFSLIYYFFVFVLLSSCAVSPTPTPTPASKNVLTLAIETTEPDRVRFSGKGAGAGMMLTSSMGAMGIAIGVAIDEGISKEIHTLAQEAGLDIEALVKNAMLSQWSGQEAAKDVSLNIVIQRYGFITQSGENDPVAGQLHLVITGANVQNKEIKYPEHFTGQQVSTAPLELVKVNGEKAIELLEEAARILAEAILVDEAV